MYILTAGGGGGECVCVCVCAGGGGWKRMEVSAGRAEQTLMAVGN